MSQFTPPSIMGIINVTDDSFFAGSRKSTPGEIRQSAQQMISDGADILDIGGESTRPGSSNVSAEEQIRRILPAFKAIRQISGIALSIDTQSAQVAEAALDAGAAWINDISAMRTDPRMARLAAERSVPIVLMHMQGRPIDMQNNPQYADVISEIRQFFEEAIERALAAGIKEENIILDPGIGFGKRVQDNVVILKQLRELRIASYRQLVGLSRKSFLGTLLNAGSGDDTMDKTVEVEKRLTATISAHAWCLTRGVNILRVHDVKEAREMINIWQAIEWAS